ncbi:MAG: M20 family metallopeptidase [Planctomycetota bacterium]
MIPSAIEEFASQHADAAVELLKELIRTRSYSGEERAIAELLRQRFADHGITAELHPVGEQGANVVGWIGSGEPTFILNCHLDTVVPAEDGWTSPPLEAHERGGSIHGLGASDMKASIASSFYAALCLRDRLPKGRLLLAYTAAEETTGEGAIAFLRESQESGFLDPARSAAVICEPTGLDHISLGNRGSVFFEIRITGVGGHGARPHLAESPILKANEVLSALPAFEQGLGERYPDRELGATTLTPTALFAGDMGRTNSIPEHAVLLLDCRMTPQLYANDFVDLRAELRGFLAPFERTPYRLEVVEHFARGGHKLAEDHLLAQTALHVLRCDLGHGDAKFRYTLAANDAVFFGEAGIPALNKLGCGLPEQAHRVDEYVPRDLVRKGIVAYASLAHRYLAKAD